MIRDAPLTTLGLEQARQVREKAADLKVQLVIASPLTRALQTAMAIFEGIAPIKVMTGHHERIEHWCDVGRTPEQLQTDFPALSFEHLDDIWWHQGPENETGVPVEPKHVFAMRIDRFRANLNSLADRPLAIVGHCNTFRELAGFEMANCEIRKYTV